MAKKLYKDNLKTYTRVENEAEEAVALKAGYVDVSVILKKMKEKPPPQAPPQGIQKTEQPKKRGPKKKVA